MYTSDEGTIIVGLMQLVAIIIGSIIVGVNYGAEPGWATFAIAWALMPQAR